jgi:hypothetical protein
VSKKRDDDRTVTRTSELVLEPRIRTFTGRRYLGGALGIFVLLVAGLFAVAKLASIEQLLSAEGANATRAIVYEMPSASELHVPLDPRNDVLRFVLHAYKRSGQLELTPRKAVVRVHAKGDRGERNEEIQVMAPGLRTRVTAEEPELAIGDPVTLDVNVSGIGKGELVVELASIDGADGLLVRAYSREQITPDEAALRETTLDRKRKEELALSTWEIGWDELTRPERAALLGARWRRLGKLRSGDRDLRSIAVAFSPPPTLDKPAKTDVLLGRMALRGDERIALLLHKGMPLKAVSDPSALLRATIRTENGEPKNVEGRGALDIPAADVEPFSVEVSADRDSFVDVRAPSSEAVEWLGYVTAFRTTPTKPVVVQSPESARVLRVTIRKPLDRRDTSVAKLGARVAVSARLLAKPLSQVFHAERTRTPFDRYEAVDPLEAPTEKAVFFVAVPRGGTAAVASVEGALDVSIAELDETKPPAPLLTRPDPGELPKTQLVGESLTDPFVARRPSNAADFDAESTKVLRIARHLIPREIPPPPKPGAPPGLTDVALAHAKHNDLDLVIRNAKPFEGIARPFELEDDTQRPLLLPIVAVGTRPGVLQIELVRGARSKPPAGLYEHWTLARTMAIGTADVHAAFPIGDDVPRGRHSLVIRDPKAVQPSLPDAANATPLAARVHLPWAITNRGPRWIAGWFEE